MESKPGDLEGLAESRVKTLQKESTPAVSVTASDLQDEENVPDPDEDDLDDLDG